MLWHLTKVTTGLLLVIIGAVLTPLPIPIGIPLALVGLVILLLNSETARSVVRRLRKKWPQLSEAITSASVHLPSKLRMALDNTEPNE